MLRAAFPNGSRRYMVSRMIDNQLPTDSLPIPETVPAQAADPDRTRVLAPAAQRALAEAEERRRSAPASEPPVAEIGGRTGPDPIRYGDWEKGGIVSDF